jgi:hypothetical protein
MTRVTLMVLLGLWPGLARTVGAQQLAPSGGKQAAEAALNISGTVAGKALQVSGGGSCHHNPDGTFQGGAASLWTVDYSGPDPVKRLELTLWRPKDGGADQLSLSLKTKSGDHRIETGTKGKPKGEGTVTILPSGPGGRLELSGKDAKGKPIQISIDCPSFGPGEPRAADSKE